MNETLKVLETRRSCRNFKPDMVKDEDLKAILEAGTYAATGMGRQSPIIIAVTNKATRDALSAANAKNRSVCLRMMKNVCGLISQDNVLII